MLLLQLLRLLLVALLDLLLSRVVGILFCKLLVFFFLPLLKFLPVFLLLRVHLFLLLLIFLILFRVSCVRSRGALHRRKVVGMDSASGIVFGRGVISPCVACSGIARAAMDRAALASGHDSSTAECTRSGGGSDRRLAVVHVRAKLRIRARLLLLLSLT